MFFKFVPTMSTAVITTFGKFSRLGYSGFNYYIPFLQELQIVSNRLCQNQCKITVRTADKVFPVVDLSIQYKVLPEDSSTALFTLSDPTTQMLSYTDNIVRKVSSGLTLDQMFQSQSHIADAILQDVGPKMKNAGFTIQSAQIRSINPPDQVLRSMNELNASQRRKIAAKNDGEAAKIKAVLMAQADAKQKQLRGKGIAAMRTNITQAWSESVSKMTQKTGSDPKQMLQFLIQILQQQTMQSMAKHAGTKVIFVDKSLSKSNNGTQKITQALEAFQFKGEHHKHNKN